jgi:NagD protein
MITSITDLEAVPLGKPSQEVLRDAAMKMNCKIKDLVVVGDDPDLEVRMALDGGATAVGVHTGIANGDVFAALAPDLQPHVSCTDAEAFRALLAEFG